MTTYNRVIGCLQMDDRPVTGDSISALGRFITLIFTFGIVSIFNYAGVVPLRNHHAGDVADQIENAVPLIGAAGSITIHHVRTLHGSAINRSGQPRPLLLISYTAADAWPLMGIADFQSFTNQLISGSECTAARLEAVPVRMPLPAAAFQGLIYENQRTQRDRAF